MGDATGIQWTEATWNPVRGCSRVSAGCDHCYAMGQAHRFSGAGQPYEGLTTIRRGKVDWVGKARLHPEVLAQPLRWKKPRRIFVNSMSDLFHESLTNEEIAAVFGVMAAAPQHTFQVLTKRPKRMREWFRWVATEAASGRLTELGSVAVVATLAADALGEGMLIGLLSKVKAWPLPNVHLGVSVEDQQSADERIPLLLETPAAVRFVSAEPLLGRIAFERLGKRSSIHMCLDVEGVLRNPRKWLQDACRDEKGNLMTVGEATAELKRLQREGVKVVRLGSCDNFDDQKGCLGHTAPGIDWVIVGGESGPGARDCEVAWIRRIVSDCQRAGVPVFVKQLGAMARDQDHFGAATQHLKDRKGAEPCEWPEDLRVRELPEVSRA